MLKRYSVRNLEQNAIEMLAEIKAEERRELGAILEDCIHSYWCDLFEYEPDDALVLDAAA
jgi:hypothetical protein